MNITTPTWNEYFNNVINAPLAHTLFYAVLVAIALVVLSGVRNTLAKRAYNRRASVPRVSRSTKRQLAREGYQLARVNPRVGYRNSSHYTYR